MVLVEMPFGGAMTTTKTSAVLDNVTAVEHLLNSLVKSRYADSEDVLEVAQALGITIRAFHLLGCRRLVSVAYEFPSSIQSLMAYPEPPVDPKRDAFIDADDFLTFIDLIDIFSDQQCDCVAPSLHRGWKDKVQSCKDARSTARAIVGFSIKDQEREMLLRAAAIHNRVFHVPAPFQLYTSEVKRAFSVLLKFIEILVPPSQKKLLLPLISELRK